MFELTVQIFNSRLHVLAEKYGTDPLPSLAQVWQDFKAQIRERASLIPGEGEFDKHTLIYLYLTSLPSDMYNMLRHVKDANGQVKEPDDPIMLENSILALGDQFLADLKKRREQSRNGSRPAGSNAGASGSGAGPSNQKKRPHKSQQQSGGSDSKGKGKQPSQGGSFSRQPPKPSQKKKRVRRERGLRNLDLPS
jgi:hypothetical protein